MQKEPEYEYLNVDFPKKMRLWMAVTTRGMWATSDDSDLPGLIYLMVWKV